MALPEDFNNIFGSTATGGLTPIGDVNYAKGWEFVGSNPPTKNDFSYLQNLSDLKSQWLYSNKLQRTDPFGDIKSDGAAAISTALENLGLGEAAKRDVGTGTGQIPDRSAWSESYTTNGWRKSPDGYIEQWGISTQTTTDTTITFPIPFPNRVLFLSEHDITGGAQETKSTWQLRGITNTGFNALNLGTISRGNPSMQPAILAACLWYAIGK